MMTKGRLVLVNISKTSSLMRSLKEGKGCNLSKIKSRMMMYFLLTEIQRLCGKVKAALT